MQTARKYTAQLRPKPFDLDDTSEVYRLLAECKGYIRTGGGTDFQGRQYAIEALDELQRRDWKMVPNPPAT